MKAEHNIHEEPLLDMRSAARLMPGQPSPAVPWRMCRKGVLARNGERVFLEHWRYGRKLYTTKTAIKAFAKATAQADAERLAETPSPKLTPGKHRDADRRAADITAAENRLKKGGLMDS